VFAKKHVFEMTQRHTLASFLDKRVIITELFSRRNCGKLALLQGKNTTEIRSPSSISACKVAVQMNFRIFECLCNKTSNLSRKSHDQVIVSIICRLKQTIFSLISIIPFLDATNAYIINCDSSPSSGDSSSSLLSKWC